MRDKAHEANVDVLPASRLSAMDGDGVLAGRTKFLEAHTPPDGKWTFTTFGASPAVRVLTDSPFIQAVILPEFAQRATNAAV